ncbi:DNA polymerase lambda isoform X2 [Actinidia eriantha]|uniref:DNA polymerase lambda isoform X2 n=1 Tax=Actinidia eriantha TaxID=165200 RepID=UPI0025835511|nr:DNA polymerase lambda isoform X2 [Actinidia eriantha]
MAPKATKKRSTLSDPAGMFAGMVILLVENGVQPRRLQIWKQKLGQMGATIEDRLSKKVTHVFAMNSDALLKQFDRERLSRVRGSLLLYKWLEDSLSSGEKSSEAPYILTLESGGGASSNKTLEESDSKAANGHDSSNDTTSQNKRIKTSPADPKPASSKNTEDAVISDVYEAWKSDSGSDNFSPTLGPVNSSPTTPDALTKIVGTADSSLTYNPPDQNQNVTEIFGKLVNIYRALGDDRRSFSYSKAIAVIEKLPFKIETADQVKHLPAIGKSMQDHVGTISLFGEVWGIGPATALKLYEKGHRTLDDLKNEDSLTNAQRLGLKYFDDIKMRIPRHEVQEMDLLLQKAAQEVLPGVVVICGGSYRRGKASCGDLDIVITHPDGKSHRGFLRKYVKHLKDINFLREDLIFSIHSEEGTDAGVDTYFGLCTYPGRELRHRIDLKVYPRDIHAFGLIAWTGNDVLNRRLRLLAESKGYRLDDTGLFPATKSSSSKRGTRASASLHFTTEKEVFDFLGFPWLEPRERNL